VIRIPVASLFLNVGVISGSSSAWSFDRQPVDEQYEVFVFQMPGVREIGAMGDDTSKIMAIDMK
jgi:hypothetical protein